MADIAAVLDRDPRRDIFSSMPAQTAPWSDLREPDERKDAVTCLIFSLRPSA